jgi:HlyD family secretion protein
LRPTEALQTLPGRRVIVERLGGPAPLEGRVRLVEPAAFTKVSALGVEEQRVKVVIDITTPADRWQALGDGYRVAVRIVTLAQDNVTKVPVSAVFPRADAKGMAVYALESGRARLVPVELGARNGSDAWVRQGLQAGASVIVYPPATVRDGQRVRQRKV